MSNLVNVSFLKQHYLNNVVPKLKSKFGYNNNFEIPKISKITLNIGIGKYSGDKNISSAIFSDLMMISGQKPIYAVAKKSIAGFSIREGVNIGVFVTLRGDKCYQFLERFIYTALTRVKDFKGFSNKSFDGTGNFSCGISDRQVFYEANNQLIDKAGLGITISTTSSNSLESIELLSLMNIPFKKRGVNNG